MNRVMVRCVECGKWYFNKHKLNKHLIEEHDYVIPLDDEEEQDNATQ